jgi:DNA-binding NarL/FixJ family response regulator
LQLSISTVKNHLHAALQKLGVCSRVQVATLLVENPWVLRFPHGGQVDRRRGA